MQTTKIRKYDTDIHSIRFGNEIRLDTTLGVPQKREDIRFMFGTPRPDEVTALRFNLSFFVMNNPKSEEMCIYRGDPHINVAYDGKELYFEPLIPNKPMLWEVASAFMLLRNGKKDTLGQSGLSHLLGAGPRTIWGQDGKGNKYAIIVEGRKWNQKGLSANEAYEVVRQMGLKDAITADGGGSSVAFVYDTQVGKAWDGRYHGRIMVGYSKYSLSQLPNLRKGARGVYVNLLQRLLKIDSDGKYGGQTKQTVKEYQQKHGLIIDGKCGPQTWRHITKGGDMVKIIEEVYNWARTNFKEQKPDTIDIHHALSPNCTAQDVHRWHLDRGWKGMAYHYFIRKSGAIHRGRQENQEGGGLLGSENKNKIEICLEGCYTDYSVKGKVLTEKVVPEAQLTALIWLVNDIKTRWSIKAIKRHADYPSAKQEGKDCPGKYFPWDQFIAQMDQGMNLIKFQTAAKHIGIYNDKVDNKAGPNTRAAEEFLKIILQILGLQDPRELQTEITQIRNDIRLIKDIANKY